MEIQFVPNKDDIVKELLPKLKAGDMVLTLGAGDIYKVGEALVESLHG